MAEKAQEHLKKSEEIIPELDLLYTKTNRPKIRFYEGTDGLKHVYEDTLTSSEAIRAFASVEDVHAALPNYFPEYYKRRAEKNIHIQAIFPNTKESQELKKRDMEEKRESTLVPAANFSFSPEINVYDNKIMIASWREKLGIVIESAEIAEAMKKIFDLALQGAKRMD